MALVQMNIRDSDVNNLKDNDVLIYCEARKYFYKTTAKSFFSEYEEKYNNLIKKYDEQIKMLLEENESLRKENRDFKLEFDNKINSHIEKNKIINERLINMVESFLKTGGKM